MLVIARKKEQGFYITTPDRREVYVKIFNIIGNRVEIGIQADTDFKVIREELIKKNDDNIGNR